ncbi:MAG: hypothetical protein CVV37_06425 [Nitrospira bacterium HGW-Nitrospira-1]|nr:MAG: hypothetical protein CVV37_06425 [Nitrospira bacterium HGW-Nitrospira-1]
MARKDIRMEELVEVQAAQEAQVDFGGAGMMVDPDTGKMRRAHGFVMTLSYSRLPSHIQDSRDLSIPLAITGLPSFRALA